MRVLSLRLVTDTMLQHLAESLPFPVGDGVAPAAGGWEAGTPNTGQFTPYVVLKCTGATDAQGRSIGRPWGAWDVTFSVGAYGGLRGQCDWVADSVRLVMADTLGGRGLLSVDQNGDEWRLGGCRSSTVGGPYRTDEVDPPYWQTTDAYQFTYDLSRTA
jgi:hypothetical protein